MHVIFNLKWEDVPWSDTSTFPSIVFENNKLDAKQEKNHPDCFQGKAQQSQHL